MTTQDQKHNGWTNYATWRVNLEMFDGYDPDGEPVSADMLQEMAENIIFGDTVENTLATSYAMAFIADVNWHEIAQHINEEYELEDVA